MRLKLSSSEKEQFDSYIRQLRTSEYVREMQRYIQHGNTTTYHHCMSVAHFSYWICVRLPVRCDIASVIRGAVLHDFFLYDWHIRDKNRKIHGFSHATVALENARRHFKLNPIEEDIIETHMWPLTITKIPRCREAVIVSFADKMCSIVEIFSWGG